VELPASVLSATGYNTWRKERSFVPNVKDCADPPQRLYILVYDRQYCSIQVRTALTVTLRLHIDIRRTPSVHYCNVCHPRCVYERNMGSV
jgi:hypothetical protein